MSQNSALLANLINAVQKGLESGKLDISDMQYLQDHVDEQVKVQIQSQAKEVENEYRDQLNTYFDEQKRLINYSINSQQNRLNELRDQIDDNEQKLQQLAIPKWLQLSKKLGVIGGAALSVILPILVVSRLLERIYDWLWMLGWWDWLKYSLIVVITVMLGLICMSLYVSGIEAFYWLSAKIKQRKNN